MTWQQQWRNYTWVQWGIVGVLVYFFGVMAPQLTGQLVILIGSVVIHEMAHGYMATWCGDPTPGQYGRLTPNPIAHMDLLGSVLLPVILTMSCSPFLFGWAKPVPVAYHRLQDPPNDAVKVALAGPLSNLMIAGLLSGLGRYGLWDTMLGPWLQYGIIINTILAVFNMIPIPPMDGSRVLYRVLPAEGRRMMDAIEPYGMWIIVGIAILNGFDPILRYIGRPIIRFFL